MDSKSDVDGNPQIKEVPEPGDLDVQDQSGDASQSD